MIVTTSFYDMNQKKYSDIQKSLLPKFQLISMLLLQCSINYCVKIKFRTQDFIEKKEKKGKEKKKL